MWRRALKTAFAVVLVTGVTGSPWIAWRLAAPRVLSVVVLDKTVPFAKYREHAALPWILEALKIRSPHGRFLDPARDYVGFDPGSRTGKPLASADLERVDVLAITDTYGVYQGDYEQPGDVAALERSPKIYGGLSSDEVELVERFVAQGGMVLAEFNTFASPTDDAPRARLEALFGVRWTHWVARFWPDLQDPREVPPWVGRLYERVHHAPFDVAGAGLVFVKDDSDIVVLRAGEDLRDEVLTQERTPAGAAYDFPERGSFWFWMDVNAVTDAEVVFEHEVHVTESGQAKLAAHGLGRRFPAVTRRRDAWYFAGDFVDNTIDVGDPRRAGLLPYRRHTSGCGSRTAASAVGEEAFFWSFYVPIVSRLFASRARVVSAR